METRAIKLDPTFLEKAVNIAIDFFKKTMKEQNTCRVFNFLRSSYIPKVISLLSPKDETEMQLAFDRANSVIYDIHRPACAHPEKHIPAL